MQNPVDHYVLLILLLFLAIQHIVKNLADVVVSALEGAGRIRDAYIGLFPKRNRAIAATETVRSLDR
jgi:hypothetical protein